jgi:LAS superfamily LD-carboxypeptidase LdcB
MNTYVVAPGDTLYYIAKKFNTSINTLMQINHLTGAYLDVGQVLYIPKISLPDGVYGPGSRGPQVYAIQRALAAVGYPIIPDGIYGNKTRNAIFIVQQKYPEALITDGIYGPKTRVYLQQQLDSDYHIVRDPYATTVLVNKHNSLPNTYIPPNLVVPNIPFTFTEYVPKKLMRHDAALALEQLFAQAKKDNISLFGVSGYRSYDTQADLLARRVQTSPTANQFIARPGESEHQTGLAIDLTSPSVNYGLVQSFGETREGQWLKENAPNFGFIIRYPLGKESITGYAYEPWHIRYVGIPAAKTISQNGLTLEDYLGRQ